jgi:hypothetical protein
MHADEQDIDAALVRRLVATRCPEWMDLPIEAVIAHVRGTTSPSMRIRSISGATASCAPMGSPLACVFYSACKWAGYVVRSGCGRALVAQSRGPIEGGAELLDEINRN